MNRHCRDPRIFAPALLGMIALTGRWWPPEAAAAAPTASAIDLPPLHGLPAAGREQTLELDPERSSVRFLVEGLRGELLTTCPRTSGRLVLGADGLTGELELRFDLASLQPLDNSDHNLDVRHVLGVLRDGEVVYRGALVASTATDLPGVTQRTWLGSIRFGSRVVRQPMLLWQCSLPGRPLRLQGHGTVNAATFGLPRRSLLGLVDDQYTVTLGLDLAWRRHGR